MTDPHTYTITVRRRDIDGDLLFEASVAEIPDLAGYGETYQEAYEFAVSLIQDLAESAAKDGTPFPQPRTDIQGEFSGRVTLRLTRAIHGMAAQAAEREGVSLNSYLSTAITLHVAAENVMNVFYSAAKDTLSNLVAKVAASGSDPYVIRGTPYTATGSMTYATPIGYGMQEGGDYWYRKTTAELGRSTQMIFIGAPPLRREKAHG